MCVCGGVFICKVSPTETATLTLLQPKGKSLLPADSCMGTYPNHAEPSPPALFLLYKNHILVDIFQLTRSGTAEAKSKVDAFRDFLLGVFHGTLSCSSLFPFWKILGANVVGF